MSTFADRPGYSKAASRTRRTIRVTSRSGEWKMFGLTRTDVPGRGTRLYNRRVPAPHCVLYVQYNYGRRRVFYTVRDDARVRTLHVRCTGVCFRDNKIDRFPRRLCNAERRRKNRFIFLLSPLHPENTDGYTGVARHYPSSSAPAVYLFPSAYWRLDRARTDFSFGHRPQKRASSIPDNRSA